MICTFCCKFNDWTTGSREGGGEGGADGGAIGTLGKRKGEEGTISKDRASGGRNLVRNREFMYNVRITDCCCLVTA